MPATVLLVIDLSDWIETSAVETWTVSGSIGGQLHVVRQEDGSTHNFESLSTLSGSRPPYLGIDSSRAMTIQSSVLSDAEIADLLWIPNNFVGNGSSSEWINSAFGNDLRPIGWDIGLKLNNEAWAVVLPADGQADFLVPNDPHGRSDFERIYSLEWSAREWGDSCSESLERWRDVAYYRGAMWESHDTDWVRKGEARPSRDLALEVLRSATAWGWTSGGRRDQWELDWLEVTCKYLSVADVRRSGDLGRPGHGPGHLNSLKINGVPCHWSGATWEIGPEG